jgi:membrane-associated phospholipid phosphatase
MMSDLNTDTIPAIQRLKVSTIFAMCCTSSYLLINYMPLREPLPLWQSSFDIWLPFLPWTIWPYILLLLTDFFFPLMIADRRLFKITMRAYALTAMISFTVWALFPTTLPRAHIMTTGDSLSEVTYRLLIAVDPPNNCFPSGHISIPTVLFWALAKQWPQWRWILWLSFGLLSLTILTTKQHYVVDLFGGLIAGCIGLYFSLNYDKNQKDKS